MALSLLKAKGRRESGAFVPLPCSVLNHKNFIALTAKSVKLLMDMASQIRFKMGGPVNNGDITIAWSVMQHRGWRSKETLHNAVNELEYYGFIMLTRQGGRHRCSLYSVTWWGINECGGKLDVCEAIIPSNKWKVEKELWKPRRRGGKKLKLCPD